jgi:hypothetical protein
LVPVCFSVRSTSVSGRVDVAMVLVLYSEISYRRDWAGMKMCNS